MLLRRKGSYGFNNKHVIENLSFTGGYSVNSSSRQLTNLSLHSEEGSKQNPPLTRRSISEPQPVVSNHPITSKPKIYSDGIKREYTITNSNTMVFMGENSSSVRKVGGNNSSKGSVSVSLAKNRQRIAQILGRNSKS